MPCENVDSFEFFLQSYQAYLAGIPGSDPLSLDSTIQFLEHTSSMIELFHDRHHIYDSKDGRLRKLQMALDFFKTWKENVQDSKEFLSDKLWFDLKSMCLGVQAMVSVKLNRFPGTSIKPAIINTDVVENHFSQLRGANAQNEHPTYLQTQYTQNAIILGQGTVSRKSNVGVSLPSGGGAALPQEHPFRKRKVQQPSELPTN